MSKEEENKIVPKLRFPEFKDDEEWTIKSLFNVAKEITEKAGANKFKLMSITSGVGLVSQLEKFGREIAGNSYKNYYVIKKGDFAYNKSSTKLYPEGEIALLEKEVSGAVPNSIFTCFRFNLNYVLPGFAKYLFINNVHGKWLRQFISVGARANGALQVNTKDLFSLPIVFPSLREQQKIANCLSSLDDLLTAENGKLEALKAHKKGLMQQLFPAEGETVPKLRFAEFRDSGEWVEKTLGEISDIKTGPFGSSLHESDYVDKGTPIITVEHLGDVGIVGSKMPRVSDSDKTRLSSYILQEADIVFSRVGSVDRSALVSRAEAGWLFSGRLLRLRINTKFDSAPFLNQLLKHQPNKDKIINNAVGQTMPSLNTEILKGISFHFPSLEEQQKIAECLSSLDELITEQAQKIEALTQHKKGLMQGLFPGAADT